MGFNPNRTYKRRASDYFLVGAAVVISLAAVVWAFLG
jgi:hypothetical protein